MGALHDTGQADLRRPDQGVGGELSATQEGPLQAGGFGSVFDRLKALGKARPSIDAYLARGLDANR
jgi:hypothetical protein